MPGAVTFDFHDTLVRCDSWFALEVRGLAGAYLRWRADERGEVVDPDRLGAADAAYRRLRQEIADHGRELPADACVARVLEVLGLPVESEAVERGVEHLMRATLDEASPMPGAVATVRAVAAADVPVGIVSSAVYHPFLEWSLAKFGLRRCFTAVVTSASAGFYKSRPEIFWIAAERLDSPPERIVHVGDSYRYDVAGARRAGMRTVWLRPNPATAAGEGGPPDAVLPGLEGAAPHILSLLPRA